MRDRWTIERLDHLRGAPVYDSAGDKIGKIDEIFYDTTTGLPEWIGLGTGFFGSKRALVPAAGARTREKGVVVPYAKDRVKDAPGVDGDEIPPGLESELHGYYAVSADVELTRGRAHVERERADEPVRAARKEHVEVETDGSVGSVTHDPRG